MRTDYICFPYVIFSSAYIISSYTNTFVDNFLHTPITHLLSNRFHSINLHDKLDNDLESKDYLDMSGTLLTMFDC